MLKTLAMSAGVVVFLTKLMRPTCSSVPRLRSLVRVVQRGSRSSWTTSQCQPFPTVNSAS